MKKKIDFRILIIFVLIIIFVIMCYYYFKGNDNVSNNMEIDMSKININTEDGLEYNKDSTPIITTTSEVTSGLTESLNLHATYYLEENYAKVNQQFKEGENILKYTNGTYLIAPYDCIITKINIPEEGEKCTNEHYIEIVSDNILKVTLNVDETKINEINLGQKASIEISAYEDKILDGVITNISSTATNGNFTAIVEFDNDGEVMIGMTAVVTIY